MADRVTITLSELHCVNQSEDGGCEPYLFTSFFTLGEGGCTVQSPKHDDVRGAFANDVEAGQTLAVPQEIGTCTLDASGQVGLVALVIDEDLSRDVAVDKAHAAFHSEVEAQLAAANGRIDEEALRDAVLSKVRRAVSGTFDYSDLHRDQDDHLGLGVHTLTPGDNGRFEVQLGFGADEFVLRGEVSAA